MKKSIAAVLFRGSIGLALVLMAAGCGFPGFGPSLQSAATGSLNLTITTDSASRTIAPATADFPAVTKYRVVMSRTGYSTLAKTFTASPCSVTGLEAGAWTVTVEGLTSADVKVASGTTTTTIAATGTNSASITLAYVLAAAGKPGSASITLEFPHSVGIDGVSGSLDGTALTLAVAAKDATTDTVVYSPSSVELGNPRLLMTLKKGSVVLMHWNERLVIYQGLPTTKTVTLAAADFASAPGAPTGVTAGIASSGSGVSVSWTSVAVAASYAVTRSDGITLSSASAIAAGTTTYTDASAPKDKALTYSVSATNTFGTSSSATSNSITVPTVILVSFDKNADGATGSMSSQNANVATGSVTLSTVGFTAPTATTFLNWNTSADGLGTSYTNKANVTGLTASITLYAQWKPFTVSFKAGTGSGTMASVSATAGTATVTLPAVGTQLTAPSGVSAFAGWCTTSTGTTISYKDGAAVTLTADMTLYAVWGYTVTFYGNNGGKGGTMASQTGVSGSNVALAAFSTSTFAAPDYQEFNGWNAVADGTGTAYGDSASINAISANATLYAQWAPAWKVSTFAGGSTQASGVDGLAASARFAGAMHLVYDTTRSCIWVADEDFNTTNNEYRFYYLRKVTLGVNSAVSTMLLSWPDQMQVSSVSGMTLMGNKLYMAVYLHSSTTTLSGGLHTIAFDASTLSSTAATTGQIVDHFAAQNAPVFGMTNDGTRIWYIFQGASRTGTSSAVTYSGSIKGFIPSTSTPPTDFDTTAISISGEGSPITGLVSIGNKLYFGFRDNIYQWDSANSYASLALPFYSWHSGFELSTDGTNLYIGGNLAMSQSKSGSSSTAPTLLRYNLQTSTTTRLAGSGSGIFDFGNNFIGFDNPYPYTIMTYNSKYGWMAVGEADATSGDRAVYLGYAQTYPWNYFVQRVVAHQ